MAFVEEPEFEEGLMGKLVSPPGCNPGANAVQVRVLPTPPLRSHEEDMFENRELRVSPS